MGLEDGITKLFALLRGRLEASMKLPQPAMQSHWPVDALSSYPRPQAVQATVSLNHRSGCVSLLVLVALQSLQPGTLLRMAQFVG